MGPYAFISCYFMAFLKITLFPDKTSHNYLETNLVWVCSSPWQNSSISLRYKCLALNTLRHVAWLCLLLLQRIRLFWHLRPPSQSTWLLCTVALLMESSVSNWEMILEHPALPFFFPGNFSYYWSFTVEKSVCSYYQLQEPYLSFFSSSPEWLKNDNF